MESIFFLEIFYLCIYICMAHTVFAGALGSQKKASAPKIAGRCELSDVGAGDLIQVL